MTRRILPALGGFVRVVLDGWGKPRVDEAGGVCSLTFGGGVVQSSMRLAEPYELDLGYTRAMMGFLLFCAEPRHILIVGLGGGSLSKYCYRHLPEARLTSLEINPDVIALRERFRVPPDDERFRVVQADASVYLASGDVQGCTSPASEGIHRTPGARGTSECAAGDVEADAILLDGYDAEGLPDRLCTESFYADCWRALSEQGVLVVNLWGNDLHRGAYLRRLRSVFGGRVWWGKSCDSGNLIAFALKSEHYYPQWARLFARARELDEHYRLGLATLVEDLRQRRDPDDSVDAWPESAG
jgi:spermidine synthase